MILRHVAAATVLALTGSTLVAGPAGARPADERRDGDHYPVSVDTTVPPGGSSSIGSPTLGKEKKLEVTVELQDGANAQQKKDFDPFQILLASARTKGEKLLRCLSFSQVAMGEWGSDEPTDVIVEDHVPIGILVLAACLETAGLINQQQVGRHAPRREQMARKRCKRANHVLPMTLEQTDQGSRLTVNTGQAENSRKSKLRIACRGGKGKVTWTVQAAKKGKTLRSVVGNRLRFGLLSRADAESSVPLTVTFDRP